jgi:four helix bundle protein
MTLEKLPKFELYEEGSQIRKSSKSVKSTIVEGYGRRRYKQEYIRFLTFAIASNDETLDHLENLYETGSLQDKELFENLHDRIEILGKKLNEGSGCFMVGVFYSSCPRRRASSLLCTEFSGFLPSQE